MKNIAFIDLEASGLGAQTWPIEVGWGYPDSEPCSTLIFPDESWSADAWDPRAENLHKISREMLEENGLMAESICKNLNDALRGRTVYSDAPDWDEFWLYRLFCAGGVKRAFSLSDFRDAFRKIGAELTPELISRAQAAAPHIHRAAADVRHMQTLYALAIEATQ